MAILTPGIAQNSGSPAVHKGDAKEPISPAPSKADTKQSQQLLSRALRLTSDPKMLPQAFDVLEESSALDPTNASIATTREYVRQELVSQHLQRGNRYMDQGRQVEAAGEFREALALDPSNAFTQQRLQDVWATTAPPSKPVKFEYASEADLHPQPGKKDFSYRGDTKQMLETIGRAFGIQVQFDSSFLSRPVRLDVQAVDFFTAMQIARKLSHSFDVPVSDTEMLVANDTQDTRRILERLSIRSFRAPGASPQELLEIMNILRTLFDLRFVQTDPSGSIITIRAPRQVLDSCAQLIDNFTQGRPQVLLEITAYEVNRSAAQQIGLDAATQFTLFNLSSEAAKLGPNAQDLIRRFLNGTLTPADLVAAQALLASGALSNSPLLKGFATFGGGTAKSGVVIPPGTAHLNYNLSFFTSLESMTLRAQQGMPATFRVGERFPVITNTFGSSLSGFLPKSLQNGLQSIVPGFTFEDLGITLKATPEINAKQDVTLQLELAIKALAGISFNNIPTISNREYAGTITIHDGETSLLAGTMDASTQKSISGFPLLSSIPGLGAAFGDHNNQSTSDRLLLLITPHVLQAPREKGNTEIYLDGN